MACKKGFVASIVHAVRDADSDREVEPGTQVRHPGCGLWCCVLDSVGDCVRVVLKLWRGRGNFKIKVDDRKYLEFTRISVKKKLFKPSYTCNHTTGQYSGRIRTQGGGINQLFGEMGKKTAADPKKPLNLGKMAKWSNSCPIFLISSPRLKVQFLPHLTFKAFHIN